MFSVTVNLLCSQLGKGFKEIVSVVDIILHSQTLFTLLFSDSSVYNDRYVPVIVRKVNIFRIVPGIS